ncbi:MAG: hypothetical protein BRC45_01165 [Cyanobacteria bacterium QS_5_48_63]|nr:MAG: hypothetical protein BRC45_01165 [Cyanobacteria bacterium QS_5_48_63]
MQKWKSLVASPTLSMATLVVSASALATETSVTKKQAQRQTTTIPVAQATPDKTEQLEQINRYTRQDQRNSNDQVNSVSQLGNVSPGDWAFEALRHLVERYGCIAGYPDSTFRSNQAMTRYEFAAGLNACLPRIERLMADGIDEVNRQEIETLQRLIRKFEAELATLGTQVDNLESRTASLEENQFSTTTKLQGTTLFSLNSAFGDEKAVPVFAEPGSEGELENNTVFNNRVRLNFNTSFTGQDILKVRLDATNLTRFDVGVTGTNMTRLAFDRNTDNSVVIGKLFYRTPLTDNLRITVDATRGRFNADVSDNFNEFFANAVKGSISNFGRFNPIYIQGAGGGGLTAVYEISDSLSLSAVYLARNPNTPTEKKGLFNGSSAALAQLAIEPSEALRLGLTYVRSYYPGGQTFVSGGTGSRVANAPFGTQTATSADHYGIQVNSRISPNFILAGWAGLTRAHAEDEGVGFNGVSVSEGDNATLFNWAVTFAFPDLDERSSRAGIVIGQPPKATENDGGPTGNENAFHLEGSYRYQIKDNIGIEPGVLVILNPEHNADNDTIVVGLVRTIFEF